MCVQVVLLAELVCDGDAGEVLAPVALDGVDVEEDGQGGEESQEDQQEDADLDTLAVHIRTAEAEEDIKGQGRVLLCFVMKFDQLIKMLLKQNFMSQANNSKLLSKNRLKC